VAAPLADQERRQDEAQDMTLTASAALTVSLLACVCDVARHRIPNTLTGPAALLGLVLCFAAGGVHGALLGLAGIAVGLIVFFPLFALGGMGAGDVKLLAALGAFLGPAAVAWTALYAAMAGGVMAVVVGFAHGYLRTAVSNTWTLLGFWRVAGLQPLAGMTLATSKSPRLPYALPITAGLLMTLWLK
jgi:prepilin peptidase CpaA